MTEIPRFRALDLILLLLVLAVAGGVRAGYLKACADNGYNAGPFRVQDDRSGDIQPLVDNLIEFQWFGGFAPFAKVEEQTAHTSPGYPWLLALLARLPSYLPPTVRWIQCGLGALTAALYFLFARRAFRSRFVGLLAGLFCALHPFWVISTAELTDGVLTSFLLAATLFLGARTVQAGGYVTSLLYGLALAGLALVRAPLLPFAFVALLWLCYRCRSVRHGWMLSLLAFLGFANGLAPWAVRNLQVFHDVIPVVDSAYLHLWMGNNPRATGGPLTDEQMLEGLSVLRNGETPQALADQLAAMKQPARYNSLARPLVQEITRDPAATVQRRFKAGLFFFFGEEWFKTGKVWQTTSITTGEGTEQPEGQMPDWLADSYPVILLGTLLGMLLLGVLGWRWSYGWARESMPAALAVIWVPLPYLLSHAETLQGPRLPLDGVLLCYAAFALACLIPGIGGELLRGSDE
jgi:4-amino-4-deoxy-L-arabinose transferase-like glycosyltransferase